MQFAGPYGVADLGHEGATLAAMRQQLAGLVGIAGGLELDDLDIGAGGGQAAGYFRGLGKRHDALSRSDPDSNCHRYAPFDAPREVGAAFRRNMNRPVPGCKRAGRADVQRASSRIMSDAFSAIMTIGALVLPDTRSGITEPSTTRRPSTPRTRSR